ncbi:hypothetical protein NW754_003817 [Fusarium falciforme]|nr:hypothetical protein NW754_003817 [Fusarium falciforme]
MSEGHDLPPEEDGFLDAYDLMVRQPLPIVLAARVPGQNKIAVEIACMAPDNITADSRVPDSVSRYVVGEGNTGTSGYYAVVRGGGGGTSTGPGAGGTYGGNQDQASNGNPGSGHDGGAGVPTPRSAGGGGGSGGGSGATLAWNYQNAGTVSPAGGGGGSSFVSSDATGVTQGLRAAVGSVVVVFSS